MRGHLEQRGKNTWRAKVFLGNDADSGNKRYVTRTIHGTKRQAESILNELLVEVGQNSNAIVDGTFKDLAQRWLALSGATLSPTTLAEYERLLDKIIYPKIGTTKVRALRAADLDAVYTDLQRKSKTRRALSSQSIAHVHALIRRLLNQAVKWGWIVANPATNASPPKVFKYDLQLPPVAVVIKLIAEADKRDPDLACFLRLATVTGARRGELCGLRWRDLDLDAGVLSINHAIVGVRTDTVVEKDTKTHAVRRISLDRATLATLVAHRVVCSERAESCDTAIGAESFVFSKSPDGDAPWLPNGVTQAFGRLCKACDVGGVRLHDLRHFAASQLLAAGVPVKTVAGRLGHANAATTLNVYAHFLESSDEVAANVLGGLLRDAEKSGGT
ncbi:MAG: tyrosine-type recombinase/integrase [Acidimicrobiales bacterium]